MQSVDGATKHERVKVEPSGEGHWGYLVEIDGEPVRVVRVNVLRDGGTVVLYLAGDRKIVFPRYLGDDDRTPRLDAEPIEVG